MTVKELIKELKSYNPQARVIINDGSDERDWSYLYHIGWSYDDDGKTNKDLVKLA